MSFGMAGTQRKKVGSVEQEVFFIKKNNNNKLDHLVASSVFRDTIGWHLKGNQRSLEGVQQWLEGTNGR